MRVFAAVAVLLFATLLATTSAQSFKKVLVLDPKSYGEVAASRGAAIMAVAEDDSFEGGAELAKELEGQVRVAVVNVKKSVELQNQVAKVDETAKFLVKPFGTGEDIVAHETIEKAKEAALASLPTDTVQLLKDFGEIQKYLVETTQETKLPVLLFTETPGIPALLTKVSYWTMEHFAYGMISNPPPELMKQLGVKELPTIVVMIPQQQESKDGGPPSVGFQGAVYDKEMFGAMKFKNVLKFVGAVGSEMGQKGYFKTKEDKVKTKPTKATKMQPLFEYTADTADACASGKLGLCVMTFIDGSPINDEQDAQLQVIRDVQESPSMKGRILTFVWVDYTCHPSIGEFFNVDFGTLPAVIAVSPKKSAFAQHVGSFDKIKISGFIGGVLGGQVKIAPLAGDGAVPTVSTDDDCAAAHAAMMPVEEEPLDDLDDIMAEMKADEATAKATMESVVEEEDDAELEEKIRKAQAEADRMNKWSNKGKGKKKKGKKNKKKKARTEL